MTDELSAGVNQKSLAMANGGSIIIPNDEKELKSTIHKLRSQNETLRNQLRDLSYKLTEALEKVRPKNPHAPDKQIPEFKEETLHKELENSNKQIAIYKREIQLLKNRVDTDQAEYKIVQLEQVLKERDKRLEDLTNEHKNLNKVVRDQEKELENYQNEEENQAKLKASAEELKSLRAKIRETSERNKNEEKNYKKQQEYISVLETKYKEICGKLGIQPNMDNTPKPKFTSQRQSASNVADRKSPQRLIEDDDDFESLELTDENFLKLKRKKKVAKQNILSMQKRFSVQIENMNNKIKVSEKEVFDLENKLKDKEKEIELLTSKVAEYKKTVRHNALQPIQNTSQNSMNKSMSKDNLKNSQNLQVSQNRQNSPIQNPQNNKTPQNSQNTAQTINAQPNNAQSNQPDTRTEHIGVEGSIKFDDQNILMGKKDSKITKITIWFDDKFIYGLQVCYSCADADIIGNQNVSETVKKNSKSAFLQIDTNDYVSSITGYYNNGLTALRFQTFKGVIKEFGSNKQTAGGQESEINIKSGEKTSGVFGSFLKATNNKDLILSSIGVNVIKYDQINEEIGAKNTKNDIESIV